MRNVLLSLLIILGFGVVAVNQVQATAITPALIEFEASRGEVVDKQVVISNTSAEEATYYISAIKFESSDDPGAPKFIPYEEDHSGLPEWIQFSEQEFTLAAGGVTTVALKIAVPSDVEAGGYYAAVLISEDAELGNVSVEAQTAVLMLVTVAGENVVQAEILELETDGLHNRLPVDFTFRVQNQGNVHVIPTGQIIVRDIFGTPVAGIPINEEMGRVLPMSTREFTASWIRNEVQASGFFIEMNNEWINFGLGRYKATLDIELQGEQTVEATTVFWMFPWHLAILAFVVLDVLIGATILRGKLAKRIEDDENKYEN